MEKSPLLTVENVLYHLRKSRSNKKNILNIQKLLEPVEKYGCENKTQQYRIVDEVVQILTSATANTKHILDDPCIIGCVTWVAYLQEKQKLPFLNDSQFDQLFQWLLNQLRANADNNEIVSTICIALSGLFALHPLNGNRYFLDILSVKKMGILKYLSFEKSTCVIIVALQCLDSVLNTLKDTQLTDEQIEVCAEVGRQILLIYYSDVKLDIDAENVSLLILNSLNILHKLIALHPDFAKLHIAELFGLLKSFFHYGIDGVDTHVEKPQKVYMSQQALYDSAEQIEVKINSEKARCCGGKTAKTRKPRAVLKTTRSTEYRNSGYQSPDGGGGLVVVSFDMRTSDSDVSEPENITNRVLYERSRRAKIRLASIALVGTISRILERRILYGYWHALFPSGTGESMDNLLYIGQHDPNLRCRSAALQVCTQLLYGSKGFLHQAEIGVKRCPTTFIPFSVSLGFTVFAIYKSLITILASESSLPVLTQALKCLAVLVQSTNFNQFKKGFVQDFVKHVKRFVYHCDVAIQVSALMVMEFLVATQETTLDIAESVGLPPKAINTLNTTKGNHGEDIEIVDDEDFVEFEDNEDIVEINENDANKDAHNNPTADSNNGNPYYSSWLLQRILHNVDSKKEKAAASLRIESLQVLIAISSHFALLKPYLTQVSEVLQSSLYDALPDVRVYAARCVDTCAFQINRYLLDNIACSTTEIKECQKFWLDIMPIILGLIQTDSEEITTVRVALCDALSNIGLLMFQHFQHSDKTRLLMVLSGVSGCCTEDTVVRAAAVRALAVFVSFPSLRSDLAFIEDIATLALNLVKDPNVMVRVKSFWSLGNISDALIGRTSDVPPLTQERISDYLLFRLINAAIVACNDNDKVRCNAVRTLGNLLGSLCDNHFHDKINNELNWRQTFENSVCKLADCLRSSGNAKVKWNTCYAISNLMRNRTIFTTTDLNWENTLYPALCHVIVYHSNFKVRINATSAITNIAERSHFGNFFEKFWSSMLEAIEQSYNLDNFHEYNHRDNLQEHLCLALSHMIHCAGDDDLPMLKKHLLTHAELIRNTWKRVINRMVPEKAAPLLSCSIVLLERGKVKDMLTQEHRNAIEFLMQTFPIE